MFRGALWLQHNGSDWGVTSFLTSTKTLGLNIARDDATTAALLRALNEVAVTPISQLSDHRLEVDDFDRMLSGDVVRDLLRWMGDGEGTRARLGSNGWEAFCNRCRDEFGFDPDVEADVTAGERLVQGDGPWARVWSRFEESPSSYGNIAGLLRRSRPKGTLRFDRSRWPDLNDEDENTVRTTLASLNALPQHEACDAILALETQHGERRAWVWSQLGQAPMAQLLEPLSRLGANAKTVIAGASLKDLATCYLDRGWQADAAAWESIAAARSDDESLVNGVVRHLLKPWLEDSARAFQRVVMKTGMPGKGEQACIEAGITSVFCSPTGCDTTPVVAWASSSRGEDAASR